MREIVHIQAGQCGNQIGAKVRIFNLFWLYLFLREKKKNRYIMTDGCRTFASSILSQDLPLKTFLYKCTFEP